MGNGCCAEDREVLTTEEKRGAKDTIGAAKDVEANLPRMREEITAVVKEIKSVDADQQSLEAAVSLAGPQYHLLTSDVADLLSLARVLLTRKSLHCTVSHNISVLKKANQRTEALVAKVLDGEPGNCLQGVGWVALLHDHDEERVSTEGNRVRRELEVVRKS